MFTSQASKRKKTDSEDGEDGEDNEISINSALSSIQYYLQELHLPEDVSNKMVVFVMKALQDAANVEKITQRKLLELTTKNAEIALSMIELQKQGMYMHCSFDHLYCLMITFLCSW